MIATGPIIDEANSLVSKFAVLQDAVGHHAPEIASAGNQDAFEPEPCAPAPFQ